MDRQPSKRVRQATRPIPPEIRPAFYLAIWDLAWSGYFYRSKPGDSDCFLDRFGSGSMIARRHGLTILWLTAIAGRFNELARLRASDVVGTVAHVQRSKRGATHMIDIDPQLIECTSAWHRRLGAVGSNRNSLSLEGESAKPERVPYPLVPRDPPNGRVNLSEGTLSSPRLDSPRGRVKETRYAAMHNSTYLLPSVSGGQLNVNVFNRDVAGPLGELFGFRLSSHCFRDTACQEAMKAVKASANLDVRAVQALMGHQSVRVTEHYIRKQQSGDVQVNLFAGETH